MVDEDVLPAGAFTYRAVDAGSGFVEHEYDYVFVAYADVSRAVPDPTEIDELAALPFDEALALVESEAGAPWAAAVLRRSFTALDGI
jgi:isopentenyldiphosphate isomerase